MARAPGETAEGCQLIVTGDSRWLKAKLVAAQRSVARVRDEAVRAAPSDSERPDRDDGPKHGKAGNRPARRVNRTIGFGPVHHRIVPVGHHSLLEFSLKLGLRHRPKVQGSHRDNRGGARRVPWWVPISSD